MLTEKKNKKFTDRQQEIHRELFALGVEVIEYPTTFCARMVIHLEAKPEADQEALAKYIKKTFATEHAG